MDMQKAMELLNELESLNHSDGQIQYTFIASKDPEKVPLFIMIYVSKKAGYRKELERFEISHATVKTVLHVIGLLTMIEREGSDPSDKDNVEKLLAELTKE